MMRHPDSTHTLMRAVFIATSALVIIVGLIWGIRFVVIARSQALAQAQAQAASQAATSGIAGFPMSGNPAPDFTLTDQFGNSVSLSSLRGHEVVMAFIDSQCKTLCPLTSQIMYDAKARLSTAEASKVILLAVNANTAATSVNDVQTWSINHGMLHQWLFLTGSAQQLNVIFHQYNVYDEVTQGTVVHDPITFLIDASGHERLYFETLASNKQADLNDEIIGLVAGMQQWLPS